MLTRACPARPEPRATHQRCPRRFQLWLIPVVILVTAAAQGAPLKVATLSTVLSEFAARIGGPEVAVIRLIPRGVDPHTFEPSPRDLAAAQAADLILTAGLDLDPALLKAIRNTGNPAATVNLAPGPDPHWWNSVPAAQLVAGRLTAELKRARPWDSAAFDGRSAALLAELRSLDLALRRSLEAIPAGRRILVTTHDAFGWFARDYGFRVYPLTGINPESEPNARELARIIEVIRQAGVKTVFFESAASPRLIAAVAEETGARVGGFLYADGLSRDGDGATYAGMMRHNISALVDGLK